MQTKQVTLYTALLLGMLVAPLLHAQVPAGAPAPPVQLADAGPKPPMPGGPRGPRSQAITSLTTLSGTVGQLTANEDGILNGFTINASSTAQTVRFGTHLGQQINAAVKSGNRVTVTGYSELSPMGEAMFKLVKLDAGKSQVVDAPPALPQNPVTPTRQNISVRWLTFG
ncbi:hypothetical protein [Spirosoma sp. KUDC1026]|uniref:hypothetical protein n=1 Tax=Spirosoma sp. KUDC1026 TaxID=2745947 RepID=UPI00159BE4D3|nr:hypothetical protein [Spirosoma sp. KUDC1026]QKZ14183.1 hypothetical protein HU175_16735 [Spirosoma sp. KUDC1026]